jgi:hypothetical protein
MLPFIIKFRHTALSRKPHAARYSWKRFGLRSTRVLTVTPILWLTRCRFGVLKMMLAPRLLMLSVDCSTACVGDTLVDIF